MTPQLDQIFVGEFAGKIVTRDLRAGAALGRAIIDELEHIDPLRPIGLGAPRMVRVHEVIPEGIRGQAQEKPRGARTTEGFHRPKRRERGTRQGEPGGCGYFKKTASVQRRRCRHARK